MSSATTRRQRVNGLNDWRIRGLHDVKTTMWISERQILWINASAPQPVASDEELRCQRNRFIKRHVRHVTTGGQRVPMAARF